MDNRSDSPIVLPGNIPVGPTGGMLEALIGHFSNGAEAGEVEPEIIQDLRRQLSTGEHFGEDMERLWTMLETVLAKARIQRSENHEDSIKLLNLACGHCEEGAVLSAFFGRTGRPVRQFAMDLRDREIEKARRRYAATEALFRESGVPNVRARENTIEFVADDATRLVGYGQVPSEFDVIFIRHQNLWNGKAVWRRIYAFALDRIAANRGTLVITSYFDREHLQALDLLRSLGGTILASARNPHSRELDYPGKSIDRHVAAIGVSGYSSDTVSLT